MFGAARCLSSAKSVSYIGEGALGGGGACSPRKVLGEAGMVTTKKDIR